MDTHVVFNGNIEQGTLLIEIATRNVVRLAPGDSVGEAARIMAEKLISSIVVTDEDRHPVGIVTERNMLHAMQSGCPSETALRKVMSSPVITVSESMTCMDAYHMCMRDGIRHLVIVDDDKLLLGVVSETDFRLHISLSTLAGRRQVMSQLAPILTPQASLRDALNLMQSQRDTCVVVVEGERPLGIVTERDIVRLYSGNPERTDISIREVMTSPVLTILLDDTINEAAERMLTARVRHLVVVDHAGRMAGLISEHDLTQNMALSLIDEKLIAEGAFLHTLVKTIPDMVWLKSVNGVYLACNSRFERYFGAKEKDIIGKTDYDFVDKDLADCFREHDRQAMENGEPSSSEEWGTYADDGHCEFMEKIKTPMHDSQGRLIGVLGIARDITERKHAEENLRISASVFENSHEGVLITDASNTITDVNTAFTRITGYSREEVIGKNPRLLSSGSHNKALYIEMWQSLKQKRGWRGEVWNQRKSGEIYAGLLSIAVICDDDGEVRRHVGVFSDITHLKDHEAELSRVAHYDALTGIPNRVLLVDRMRQSIAQTAREQNMMAVCYLDLDGFKPINDSMGHDAGDQILIEVARRIENTIRGGDTVARLGGDEFVVLLRQGKGEECVVTLKRLLAEIARPITVKNKSHTLSASIGVSIYPLDDEDPDILLRHADQAMYMAKQSGKNRFHIYDPSLDIRARKHHEFLQSIRHGLEHDQFELLYQPKINLRTKKLVGAEALIRWRHPERGLLSPAEFLRPIENTELDIEIGEWVTATALAQMNRWRHAGLDIEISINISAHHLESFRFAEKLKQQLAHYPDMSPGKLQIEVLETAALNDIAIVREIIEACRKLGVGFALDDFGTGYSSLSYLSILPVDVLKIDQSFIRGMLKNKGDMAIVQGIVALARAFDRQIVAEGIEIMEHYQTLLDIGCEIGQGYCIARPMQAGELTNWCMPDILASADTKSKYSVSEQQPSGSTPWFIIAA
jgi:diguanylate cyclase (GGDEF)-like protein/PAS domain S-box-containing protein